MCGKPVRLLRTSRHHSVIKRAVFYTRTCTCMHACCLLILLQYQSFQCHTCCWSCLDSKPACRCLTHSPLPADLEFPPDRRRHLQRQSAAAAMQQEIKAQAGGPAASRGGTGRLRSTQHISASKQNVVQQAKLLDSAGTAWHAVKYGNLEMITKLFPSQCNVYKQGPVGENVFHIALLLNTPSSLAIAKYLVKLYGKTLVNTPYQERRHETDPAGQYEGETALHIAIVNRDFDMVKFLIQAGAEIRARCYGKFFQAGSPVYYGEYPLSFAASTGQKDIVSYLKRHGARVNQDCDMYGNTALHLAACHDHLDMYDHLVEYCGASEHVRNNRGATPLLLAASLGKLEVFQHIYNKRRKVAWAYGPVTSYSLSLHEIDSVQNSRRTFVPSAIETIVRKGHMHMIDDPLVRTLLNSKWARFAAAQFLLQGLLYLALVLVQTFLVWLHCSRAWFNTSSRQALEVCALILAVLLLIVELLDQVMWTRGVYHRRQLMTCNMRYCPPLYPIPGEAITHETPTKLKPGFLSRIMKGSAAAMAEAITSQGIEAGSDNAAVNKFHEQQPRHHTGRGASRSAGVAIQWLDNPWWGQDAVALHMAQQAGDEAMPVAEGTAGDTAAAGGGGGQFQQVDDTELSSQGPWQDGFNSLPSPIHGSQPSMRAAMCKSASLPPCYPAARQDYQPDIVSVGLGGGAALQATQLQRAPSFFVNPPLMPLGGSIRTPASNAGGLERATGLHCSGVLSAHAGALDLGTHPAPLPPGLSGCPADVRPASPAPPRSPTSPARSIIPAARPSEAHAPGTDFSQSESLSLRPIGREASMDSTRTTSTEIKNRLRGGGGGDFQAGGMMMMTRRSDGSKDRAEADRLMDDAPQEEAREPLHVGGLRGHFNTLVHSLVGYYSRQARDPITLLIMAHILLTITHFVTWASTYGMVDGPGPRHEGVREFDDILLSLTALAGWFSLLYFARGLKFSGQLAVMVELCLLEVIKWAIIFFVFNIGFTLAFYTLLRGSAASGPEGGLLTAADPAAAATYPQLTNIGSGIIQLLRFLFGEADYGTYTDSPLRSLHALATTYFILYIGIVLLLLGNLLTAVILTMYKSRQGHVHKVWLLRWASYVLRAEARMPLHLQQYFRLGEVSYDPAINGRVYNHVFEVVEEPERSSEEQQDKDIKSLEGLLERLRKDKLVPPNKM